ncbi:MAG: hypothetical protein P4L53_17565 [Candidatus Obscuribacterales bacterium]|nr:hypothetical protein [Candidatus Obscuribacterales bacterium]
MKMRARQMTATMLSGLLLLAASEVRAGESLHEQGNVKLALQAEQGILNTDLSVIHDWRLVHKQMKELAINLHLEASRCKPAGTDSCEIKAPSTLPAATILDKSQQLQPRAEWVAYYLNSMEPLLDYVTKSLRASETGTLKMAVPKGTSTELSAVIQDMYAISHRLEDSLDRLNEIFNQEQPSAESLKDVVTRIFEETSKIEAARCRYYEVLKKAEKAGVKEFEFLPHHDGKM